MRSSMALFVRENSFFHGCLRSPISSPHRYWAWTLRLPGSLRVTAAVIGFSNLRMAGSQDPSAGSSSCTAHRCVTVRAGAEMPARVRKAGSKLQKPERVERALLAMEHEAHGHQVF